MFKHETQNTFYWITLEVNTVWYPNLVSLQGRMKEFWKGDALRISDNWGPTMVGGKVPENFEN